MGAEVDRAAAGQSHDAALRPDLDPVVGNPEFTHDRATRGSPLDAGFRILALFRLWNEAEFVVFELSQRLVEVPVPFARFTKEDLSNPGSFSWTEPVVLQRAVLSLTERTTSSIGLLRSRSLGVTLCWRFARVEGLPLQEAARGPATGGTRRGSARHRRPGAAPRRPRRRRTASHRPADTAP